MAVRAYVASHGGRSLDCDRIRFRIKGCVTGAHIVRVSRFAAAAKLFMRKVEQVKRKARGTSREHIIDVSRAIIEDEGVEQLTIRRIAETVQRTQPAVYQHFEGKDAILAAVVVEGFTALIDRLKRSECRENASLIALANAYVCFGLERPRLYEIMFVGPPAITFADPVATPMPAQTAFQIFATAVARSGVAPAQIETATEIVWAALHGLVMLSITKRLRPGRIPQRMRLETLTAGIVAMITSK